jgi:hypothetical protein
MHAERTFWEKATAIHVFCLQERLRGDRFARHWHDVVRLDEAGFAEAAFADRELANAVARHKSMFFAEKAADRTPIDYAAAVNGGLQLVPAAMARRRWRKTMPAWSRMGCSSTTRSRSKRSWRGGGLLKQFGIDLGAAEYARNLERLMELLFSLRFVLVRSSLSDAATRLKTVESIIKKVQTFLWAKCTNGAFANGDHTVVGLYESFYRKLVLRDRSLPRPWVFTTNYDLFNETAMDRLGLPYTNGFSGVVERRFNPATFRYALAEQLDVTSRKWSAVDGFVYLCKIHGSISWTEDDHGLFPIRETAVSKEPGKVMIYPTPAKQNSSLGSPYADLFREFQSRIVREQSVLFTMGYAFGDEHINNIIYQALTIPTFRLVIFVDPDLDGEIAKLRALNDPRIWIIGGAGRSAGRKAHYFDTIIEEFMPQRPSERIDDAVRKVIEAMAPKKEAAAPQKGEDDDES